MAYKESDIILVAKKPNTEETRAFLIYIIPKKEYCICSHFKVITNIGENNVDWDWGHYYNDFLNAILDFYKEDFDKTYKLKYNYDILVDLQYNEEITEEETEAVKDMIRLIKKISENKEI